LNALLSHGERAIAAGSRSFASAARLLDRDTRSAAVLLYAWCRHADDLIDGQSFGSSPPSEEGSALQAQRGSAPARLEQLRDLTRRALAGEPMSRPEFAGLQAVVLGRGLPADYPLALLDGFAMDVRGDTYGSLQDTLRYCYHVAGVVGLMMAHVMGVRDAATLDRACDLGLAFQLTNIARDLADDARVGRVYVPAEWLREAGVSPADLAGSDVGVPIQRLRIRLLDAAEPYYASAAAGVRRLPFRCAWAVAAARNIYRDIGREIRRRPTGRAHVAAVRKLAWIGATAFAPGVLRVGLRDAAGPARHGLWSRPA
jgi:phytoene synthase